MLGASVRDLNGTPVFCGSLVCDLCLMVFQLRERCLSKKSQKMTSFESVSTCNDHNFQAIQVVVAILRYSFLRSCFGIFINWIFYVKQTYQKAV